MGFVSLFNYVVDPYQQYRKAKFYSVMYMNGTERYLNAGLAKTYPYDSVVIGSSMMQNFLISDVAEYLGYAQPIKLTTSGSDIFEEAVILETAIATSRVKNVLFGLDIFSLHKDGLESTFPLYLYDDNTINDYKYLFNIDTLKRSILYPVIPLLVRNDHPRLNYNLMYQWQHLFDDGHFNDKRVLEIWRSILLNDDLEAAGDMRSFSKMKGNFDNVIMPIVNQQHDIKFIFFFPPYSSLAYKLSLKEGTLADFIEIKKYIVGRLSGLPNVELHDLQIAKEITHNLNNYMDLSHYHQEVTSLILMSIRNNTYKVTAANVDAYANELLDQTVNYSVPGLSDDH